MSEEQLKKAVIADTLTRLQSGKHYLAISDTTDINLKKYAGRREDYLQVIGKHKVVGFYLHPTLLLESQSYQPVGFSDIQMWARDPEQADKTERNYQYQQVEDKESYRWLEGAKQTQGVLPPGVKLTLIHDREADMYAEWCRVPDANTHLLIRSSRDYKVCFEGKEELVSLKDGLKSLPIQGQVFLEVQADTRRKRSARMACLNVRFSSIRIRRPGKLQGDYPDTVQVYVVEAQEDPSTVPAGEEPIHWRLLTTHQVITLQEAQQILQWYAARWTIEVFFEHLKKGGLNIEKTQLGEIDSIHKLCILALPITLTCMGLVKSRNGNSNPATNLFSEAQTECLQQLAPTLEGATAKQQNPFPPLSMAWASWIIARLGGWSGYQSQRPPGMETFARGLQLFYARFDGWLLARSALTFPSLLVYTP